MGNVIFVVFRESAEAMLVLGILSGWLRTRPEITQGRRWLVGGALAGLLLALGLAAGLLDMEAWAGERRVEITKALIPLVASGLILQMVFWMRQQGPNMRRHLEQGLERSARQARGWGIAALATIAIGREGVETVVFLAGTLHHANAEAVMGIGVGLLLALAFYFLLSRGVGNRWITWRIFFQWTEILLLLLGGALLVESSEHFLALDILPALGDPLWSTRLWLDDSRPVGELLASFTGYRSSPAGISCLLLATYWVVVAVFSRNPKSGAAHA